jgi:hypothetical protein
MHIEREWKVLLDTLAKLERNTREFSATMKSEGMLRMVADLDQPVRHHSVEGIVVVPTDETEG